MPRLLQQPLLHQGKTTIITPQIEAVLSLAMAPSPIDRFSTAEALAKAYDDACRGELSEDLRARAREIKWQE